MAATQERTRLRRINGYGSKAFAARTVLTTIHKISTPVNEKMNAQLPANFAIASAARCPSVYFSAVGLSEILLSASRFRTSSSVISCRMSLRTSFRSLRFSFMGFATPFGDFFLLYSVGTTRSSTAHSAFHVCAFCTSGRLLYCFRSFFPTIPMPARISTTESPIRMPEMKSRTSVPPTVPDIALLAMPRVISATP